MNNSILICMFSNSSNFLMLWKKLGALSYFPAQMITGNSSEEHESLDYAKIAIKKLFFDTHRTTLTYIPSKLNSSLIFISLSFITSAISLYLGNVLLYST